MITLNCQGMFRLHVVSVVFISASLAEQVAAVDIPVHAGSASGYPKDPC